jgi:hypothetical protein
MSRHGLEWKVETFRGVFPFGVYVVTVAGMPEDRINWNFVSFFLFFSLIEVAIIHIASANSFLCLSLRSFLVSLVAGESPLAILQTSLSIASFRYCQLLMFSTLLSLLRCHMNSYFRERTGASGIGMVKIHFFLNVKLKLPILFFKSIRTLSLNPWTDIGHAIYIREAN